MYLYITLTLHWVKVAKDICSEKKMLTKVFHKPYECH